MRYLWLMLGVLSIQLSGCATTTYHSKEVQIDRISPEMLQKLIPAPVATITLDELLLEAKQGKSSDELIDKIKSSNSRYELTAAQMVEWNQKGLDIKVLDYIQQSNELAKQNAIADEMNSREKIRLENERKLQRERDLARLNRLDPYWGMYGYPWIGPVGPMPLRYGRAWPSRFGWYW